MAEVTLSSKNQIVVPREAREALGIRSGDRILVVVRNSAVILLPKPKNHAAAIRGIGQGSYPRRYLQKERESWD
jgi:AbrB family looped-hinge helix DNA binding protein